MLMHIFKFRVDPAHRAEIEQIEDEVAQFYVPENGFTYTRFFGDPEIGWYGNVSIWENMDHVKVALAPAKLVPIVGRLKPLLLEAPVTEVYPVYELQLAS